MDIVKAFNYFKVSRLFTGLLVFVVLSCSKEVPGKKEVWMLLNNAKCKEFRYGYPGELMRMTTFFDAGNIDGTYEFKYQGRKLKQVSLYSDKMPVSMDVTASFIKMLDSHGALRRNGVKVGDPFLVGDEINDFHILASAVGQFDQGMKDNYSVNWAKDIDVNVLFESPVISGIISPSSRIHYFEYVLNEKGYLVQEFIQFDKCGLKIAFSYDNGKITEIDYKVMYSNGKIEQKKKKFLYGA